MWLFLEYGHIPINMKKNKYKINLNWYGNMFVYYLWAFTESQVGKLAMVKLSEKLMVSKRTVSNYFLNHSMGIAISEIKQ